MNRAKGKPSNTAGNAQPDGLLRWRGPTFRASVVKKRSVLKL